MRIKYSRATIAVLGLTLALEAHAGHSTGKHSVQVPTHAAEYASLPHAERKAGAVLFGRDSRGFYENREQLEQASKSISPEVLARIRVRARAFQRETGAASSQPGIDGSGIPAVIDFRH